EIALLLVLCENACNPVFLALIIERLGDGSEPSQLHRDCHWTAARDTVAALS
ncbi:hypothetical protein J6590_017933, partial [Homalodisca vitripennis]